MIQKTRFGERFQYEIEIEKECYQIPVPKLLLQPLIENSLKYGFRKKPRIFVTVRGWLEHGYLYLQVEDDGPGQPKACLLYTSRPASCTMRSLGDMYFRERVR